MSEFIFALFPPALLLPMLLLVPMLLLMSSPAHAKDGPLAPGITRTEASAFGLGFALRTADLRATAYAKSVQSLRDVTDPSVAGAEVAHFSSEVPKLRRSQAASYTAAGALLTRMGAPLSLRDWAGAASVTLNAPLIYTGDAKKLAKTEPATAATLAELAEITSLQAAEAKQQASLTLWLQVSGGKTASWCADTGTYTAELRRAAESASVSPLIPQAARVLLQAAPPSIPAAARESLATLAGRGGGNLSGLATVAPASITPAKLTRAADALLALYGAGTLAETLDKNAE